MPPLSTSPVIPPSTDDQRLADAVDTLIALSDWEFELAVQLVRAGR